MVQIPLISGIYGGSSIDFERSVPVNLTPIAEPNDGSGTGVSRGYLRIVPGIDTVHEVFGRDRGTYLFDGRHLRVVGDGLFAVGDELVRLGTIENNDKPVQFAEGFNRLAIASAGKLYYLVGTVLTEVTDPDLGDALSVAWSDGYFVTTDGTALVATELNDPTSVDPLKYGSSEADPDPVIGVLALRGELYALNRFTIEKFINAGTTGFPFQRSRGSQIPKGIVGPSAYSPFVETFAFCGSAQNETAAIFLAGSGQAIRISPRALDRQLATLTDAELAAIELEALNSGGQYQLIVHLPMESWVYHWTASQLLDIPVWSKLAGGADNSKPWPARHYQLVGTDWWCGTQGAIGRVSPASTSLFGAPLGYRFDTPLIFNEARGAVAHDVELVARGNANVALSYTNDGQTWSQERFSRAKRLSWRRLGRLSSFRGFRFRGVASSPVSFARLDVKLEPLDG